MIRPLILTASIFSFGATWANGFFDSKFPILSQLTKAVQLSQAATDTSSTDTSTDTSSTDTSSTDTSSTDTSSTDTSSTDSTTTTDASTTVAATPGSTIIPKTREIIKFAEPVLTLDLNIEKKYANAPEVRKMLRMLGMKKKYTVVYFVDNKALGRFNLNDNVVAVQTRSFVNMLDFLSNAVKVPVQAYEQGLVLAPKCPNGEYFDVTELTRGILNIYMSKERPRCDVNVQIYYRNHWFYIMDTDTKSKRTFSLVQQIFNFLSGTTKNNLTNPIITIPVR